MSSGTPSRAQSSESADGRVSLRAGKTSAVVDARHGGRLASLVAGGRERLIDAPVPGADVPGISWGSFAMIPWVGRIRGGRLEWRGRSVQLSRNLRGHAIHGATFDVPWEITEAEQTRTLLRCRLGAGGTWPYRSTVTQEISLEERSLRFRIEIAADEPMPAAVGWHPWFRRSGDEPITVSVAADHVLETDPDLIPTGALEPVAERTDLRAAPDVTDRSLDHSYVGSTGPATITWPDLELTIEAAPLGSFVVHTTAIAFCVEPQTAWPDAFRLAAEGHPSGAVVVRPGQPFVATSTWSWTARSVSGRIIEP